MLEVPYITSGQELGETRSAMARTLMGDIEKAINKYKDKSDKYYLLVHAKPFPLQHNMIKIKIIGMDIKPHMLLSCMLFGVENKTGKLTLEWALPGSWPTWSVGGTNEPVPEVIASINELGRLSNIDMDKLIAY